MRFCHRAAISVVLASLLPALLAPWSLARAVIAAASSLAQADLAVLLLMMLTSGWFLFVRETDASRRLRAAVPPKPTGEEYFQRLIKRRDGAGFDVDMSQFGGKEEDYCWSQTDDELEVTVPVPPGTRAKDVRCTFMPNSLTLIVGGVTIVQVPRALRPAYLCINRYIYYHTVTACRFSQGRIYHPIRSDDCDWTLGTATMPHHSVCAIENPLFAPRWRRRRARAEPYLGQANAHQGQSTLDAADTAG